MYKELQGHIFDLENGPLMRVVLLSVSATKHYLLIGYHHAILDGISLEILLADFQRAYDGELAPSPVLQYHEWCTRQQMEDDANEMEEALRFWRTELSNLPPPLPLLPMTAQTSRSPLVNYAFHRAQDHLPTRLHQRVQTASRRLKVTPFHFHLTTLRVLISRLVNVEDLIIGMSDGNRLDADTLDSLGLYLNIIPLRFRRQGSCKFSTMAEEAKSTVQACSKMSKASFDTIMSDLHVSRSATHAPISQVLINYRSGVRELREFCGCSATDLRFEPGQTGDDILLDITDNAGGDPLISFCVQQSLYSTSDAHTLLHNYIKLLGAFAADVDQDFDAPPMYDEESVQNALRLGRGQSATYDFKDLMWFANYLFTGPSQPCSWGPTLSHRIASLAEEHAQEAAIIFQDDELTYGVLVHRVNAIAVALTQAGVRTGDAVGIFLEPCPDWVASLLAILQMGAVYVPLDTQIPLERLSQMSTDSQLRSVLANPSSTLSVQKLELMFPNAIIDLSTVGLSTETIPAIAAVSTSVAIRTYTSGSTGVPKGTNLTNEGLLNHFESITKRLGLQREVILQQASFAFDMSIWQVFLALANAGVLVIASKAERLDAEALVQKIVSNKVSMATGTPSELQTWFSPSGSRVLRSSELTVVLVGAEQPKASHLRTFHAVQKLNLRFINCYGPSEVTIASNVFEMDPQKLLAAGTELSVPAGSCLPNCSAYILDANSHPLPPGIAGEIYIGGAGIAKGYLRNPTLTGEKFVEDKFVSHEFRQNGWVVAHRTGDRGRLLPNGDLVVEGRIDGDYQIKLRGVRIDLRDIESTIVKHGQGVVSEAVATLRSATPETPAFLLAHVIMSSGSPVKDVHGCLETLRQSLPLPQYMVPTALIAVDHFPRSISGKTSRSSIQTLPLPSLELRNEALLELTSEEETMKAAWLDVLPPAATQLRLHGHTDFFQVGGSSLLLVQLQKSIKKHTGHNLSLVEMFQASSLRAMSTKVFHNANPGSSATSIDWIGETELPAVSILHPGIAKTHRARVRVVVLTGATGFLGQKLAEDLIAHDDIDKVHIVAVRSKAKSQHLPPSTKVEIHYGDLREARLGLDEATSSRIFQEADAIIHNGADVSFLKTYASLRDTNVGSTKEILALALRYDVAVHFVSTAGVGQILMEDEFRPVSVAACKPAADGLGGYISSKWVSECLIEKAAVHYGLRATIYRPSTVTGKGVPEHDVVNNLMRYSEKLLAVPHLDMLRGYLNFVPVEQVAHTLTQHVMAQDPSSDPRSVRFFHLADTVDMKVSQMQQHMEAETGHLYTLLPLTEWVEEARKAGMDGGVASYLASLDSLTTPLVLPRLVFD